MTRCWRSGALRCPRCPDPVGRRAVLPERFVKNLGGQTFKVASRVYSKLLLRMPPIWGGQWCLQRNFTLPTSSIALQAARALQTDRTLRAAHADHWPELALSEVANQVEGVRCRQHANPLRKELQVQLPPQDWAEKYADPVRPLIVDIGCGPGRFLLALSHRYQGHNMLGLDIREKLIERANGWTAGLSLHSSVHFMMANATISLGSMLSTYPGPLSLVTVQFPDPHFKTKHKKRRVIQPQVVTDLAKLMPPGGRVFLQSDVKEAATAMYHEFQEHGSAAFHPDTGGGLLSGVDLLSATSSVADGSSAGGAHLESGIPTCDKPEVSLRPHAEQGNGHPESISHDSSMLGQADAATATAAAARRSANPESDVSSSSEQGWPPDIQWLPVNPLGVPTEREVHTHKHGGNVYRALLVRR